MTPARTSLPPDRVVDHIIIGWTVGPILTIADGASENATQLADSSGLGMNRDQPEYVGLGP